MVHVEQAALGRLEQDALARLARRRASSCVGVGDVRPDLLARRPRYSLHRRVGVELLGVRRQAAQQAVLALDDGPQPLAQMIGMEQLADADGDDAADLVLVARADAAAGGADGLLRRPPR